MKNKEPKFTKLDYFENGQIKTNHHIDGEPVSESAYITAQEYYFEQNKNVHVKSEEKSEGFTLHPQYIQTLEEDYDESYFECFEDYNEMCDRCNSIMDLVREIRECETDKEAFELLTEELDMIQENIYDQATVDTIRKNSELLNNLADSIENEINNK